MVTINVGGCCCPGSGSGSASGSGSIPPGSGSDVVGDGCTTCFNCCRYFLSPPDELYFTVSQLDCEVVDSCGDFPCELAALVPDNEYIFYYQDTGGGTEFGFLAPPIGGGVIQSIVCEEDMVVMKIIPIGWDAETANLLTYAIPIEDWRCERCNTFFLIDIPTHIADCNSYATSIRVCWRRE